VSMDRTFTRVLTDVIGWLPNPYTDVHLELVLLDFTISVPWCLSTFSEPVNFARCSLNLQQDMRKAE
jgi:hypothetical protein